MRDQSRMLGARSVLPDPPMVQWEMVREELRHACDAPTQSVLTRKMVSEEGPILPRSLCAGSSSFGPDRQRPKPGPLSTTAFDVVPDRAPSPLRERSRMCSVVGASGVLKGRGCGAQIDAADYVFRVQ